MQTLKKSLWIFSLVLFLSLMGFFGGWISGESRSSADEISLSEDSYESLRPLIQSMSLIRNNYVDEEKIKQKDLVYGAIKGMVDELDPYSQFMDPQSFKDMKQATRGAFGGLGIKIAIRDDQLVVVSPIDGTPADRGRLKPRDKIMKIDGESTEGIDIMDAVHKMRGKKGTECVLTIRRPGVEEWFDVSIIRDIIRIQSVRYEMLEGDIGYVRVTEFVENTTEDFGRALQELEKRDMQGLILDLRNNPGGLLNKAAEIAEYFVPQGKLLVYTEGRNQAQNMRFFSTAQKHYRTGPLAVLVNQGSASASEIVAGAIQDWKLGVVVGTQTFGKGSVQTIIPLNDGSALRITTARYLTPKGQLIHGNGITPDLFAETFRPNAFSQELIKERRFEEFARFYLKLNPRGEPDLEEGEVRRVKVSEASWEKLKPKTRDQLLEETFVKWLKEQHITYSEAELIEDRDLLLNRIRQEIALIHEGSDASRSVQLRGDPQIQRARDAINIAQRYRP